jgi:hypothetical protein
MSTATILRTEIVDIDAAEDVIPTRMEELCRACDDESATGQTYATCEPTAQGYRVVVTDEPQN